MSFVFDALGVTLITLHAEILGFALRSKLLWLQCRRCSGSACFPFEQRFVSVRVPWQIRILPTLSLAGALFGWSGCGSKELQGSVALI